MHIHEQLPGIALDDFQDVQQPFISFRINVQPAGAGPGKGSADQMGQRQTGGDLPVMFRGGRLDDNQAFGLLIRSNFVVPAVSNAHFAQTDLSSRQRIRCTVRTEHGMGCQD